MTQVIYAGEPEYSWQKTATEPNGRLAAPRAELAAVWPGRGLALLLVLALHAAVLLLLQRSATPPLITPPRPLPISIELAAAPQAPEPVAQAPSVAPPVEETPPVVDENALKPAPPLEKPRPPAKVAEKTAPKPPEKKRPQKAAKPADKPVPQAPVSQTAANNAVSQSSQPVTPPLANADYLHNPAPEYPEVAISRGQEGTVLLNVQVGPDGKVLSVRLQKSSGYTALDKAAQDTVRRWSFVPARRGSQAVSGSVIVPIDFSLDS